MPNRIIRETILTSERVDALDAPAEVFYRRLMSAVDDFGRFDARPMVVKAACFPLRADRVRVADISRWLAACQAAGLVALYEVGGKPYLELLNLEDRRRAKHSKYPEPHAGVCAQVIASASISAHVRPNAESDAHAQSETNSETKGAAEAAFWITGKGIELPKSLQTKRFIEAWRAWETHLKQKKVRTTGLADKGQLDKCEAWGPELAIQCIHHSISGNYQGLFKPSKEVPTEPELPQVLDEASQWADPDYAAKALLDLEGGDA